MRHVLAEEEERFCLARHRASRPESRTLAGYNVASLPSGRTVADGTCGESVPLAEGCQFGSPRPTLPNDESPAAHLRSRSRLSGSPRAPTLVDARANHDEGFPRSHPSMPQLACLHAGHRPAASPGPGGVRYYNLRIPR